MLGVGTIGALNDAIAAGKGEQIVLLQEALMEERIGALAAQIAERGNVKFVMIAGPSSSGKTSFSNRLSIQLLAKGFSKCPNCGRKKKRTVQQRYDAPFKRGGG